MKFKNSILERQVPQNYSAMWESFSSSCHFDITKTFDTQEKFNCNMMKPSKKIQIVFNYLYNHIQYQKMVITFLFLIHKFCFYLAAFQTFIIFYCEFIW